MPLQRQSMSQNQKFSMTPQLYQSIKLMELPIMDLRTKIGEELERNPALEVLEDPFIVSLDAASNPPKEEKEEYDYFERAYDPGFVSHGKSAAAYDKLSFIEGTLTRAKTLQEHLLMQLALEPVSGDIRRISELLIQNLDEDGFHKEPVEILLKNEDPKSIEKALKLVQGLDPAGTCTKDYMESLMVQVDLLPDAPRGIEKALSCLELFERGKIAEAAKTIGCTEAEGHHIFERLKELSPFPGRQFSSVETRFVVPDIQVIEKEGEFVIVLNEEEIPVLGINPFFMKMAGDGRRLHKTEGQKTEDPKSEGHRTEGRPVRDFARENIKEARWFINSINQRNHTLLKVSRAIVEFQRPFFMSGPKQLAPLTLKDIAQELGMHETTVSRTANGKYMQTEWSIFELRHFFTNSISGTGSGGSRFSKEGVKEMIREIIQSENKRLSDQDIVEHLETTGIHLARRTVAKYRNELNLGSSFDR